MIPRINPTRALGPLEKLNIAVSTKSHIEDEPSVRDALAEKEKDEWRQATKK